MKKKTGGRPPKNDPANHLVGFKLTSQEMAQLEQMMARVGVTDRSRYIKAVLFGRQLKVVKIDKAAMDYYMRLTTFHSQFRAVGTNYNQVTKAIKATFTEKKALAFLYRLEKATLELVATHRQVLELTDEFERKHLSSDDSKD
jgi:hypothetical protein